jgi:solute carrier family 10 (sodium/bile acid cotransporter), member 7
LNPQKKNPSIVSLLEKAGLDWFLIALLVMILMGYFFPGPGIQEGPFTISWIARYGVSAVFFFYGLKLSPQKLRTGLSSYRLHIVIQLSTFLLFPLLVLPFYSMVEGTRAEIIWLGTFFLAALPSTVSSSVVMVSIAGGNIPAAIFNASVSSLLGIFVTPLWMGIFLTASPAGFDIMDVLGNLILQVLVPVIIGLALNRKFGEFAEKNKGKLKVFDQSIILMIIYTSFSESFSRDMFSGLRTSDLLLLSALLIGLFFLVYGLMSIISNVLSFNKADKITTIFCGSKKSLVHGTVMSKVLFPDATAAGIILLPIMIYHAFQLLIASIVAQRWARRSD